MGLISLIVLLAGRLGTIQIRLWVVNSCHIISPGAVYEQTTCWRSRHEYCLIHFTQSTLTCSKWLKRASVSVIDKYLQSVACCNCNFTYSLCDYLNRSEPTPSDLLFFPIYPQSISLKYTATINVTSFSTPVIAYVGDCLLSSNPLTLCLVIGFNLVSIIITLWIEQLRWMLTIKCWGFPLTTSD